MNTLSTSSSELILQLLNQLEQIGQTAAALKRTIVTSQTPDARRSNSCPGIMPVKEGSRTVYKVEIEE